MSPSFTPFASLVGGLLIGLAATLLALVDGRIAGISGIAAGLASAPDRAWRAMFLAGLVLAASLAAALGLTSRAAWTIEPSVLVAAGLLVGVGTRLANGCTSGHGVCGLARLSRRSLVATLTFLTFGAATVAVVRHADLPWIGR